MKKNIFLYLLLCASYGLPAQITASATANSGSGYSAIIAAGLDVENPDCEHTDFGAHITQAYDAELDRNVFEFHSHIDADNDRCLVFDRVRMEIKGGPNTDIEAQHLEGTTSYYRWKFRLEEDFIGTSSFCHLFQNKAFGGNDSGFPVLTITARANVIEVKHSGGDTGTDLGTLVQADLAGFKGRWVEAYLRQVSSENGALEVTLRDMETGQTLLSYENSNIDLWRTNAEYNRPKWGVYRAKSDVLQDEVVRFADFCISETSEDLCPAEAVLIMDVTPPTAPANLTASNETISTVELDWDAASDDFGVTDYLVLQDGLEVATTTEISATMTNLSGGTTYTFTVQARDEAGNVSAESNTATVTTDPADATPDVASNPTPEHAAIDVSTAATLNWAAGSNTETFRVHFGTETDPPAVSTQVASAYTPTLEANITYYWQIIAINANGETPGPIWSFTTGETTNDLPWFVYRANARMGQETNFWELESEPSSPMADEVTIDPLVPINNLYNYRDDSDNKFRWRTDLNNTDKGITIVARLQPFSEDVNGMCHFEIRVAGWRQKVRLNDGNIKLEATTPVVERDLDFDWDDGLHLIRIVVNGPQTVIYLDEDPLPFLEGYSDESTSLTYFDWGKGGGSDYGATIDWLAFDPNVTYAPGEGPVLPADLILSNDATLTSLTVNEVEVTDFASTTFDYNIDLAGADLPTLNWVTGSPLATVEVNNPSNTEGDQATITVFAQDGYSQNTYTLNYLITSLDEADWQDWLRIFPNPATEQLQLRLPAGQSGTAAIFNTQGSCVKSNLMLREQTDWDVSELPAGTYLLQIQLSDQRTQLRKIIIH